ncbi:hypothetical protein LMH73_008695 [Vibrio splendidus]|nr:hypothetical protein [Vibrio splendidus]MCC4879455.1 hypothetical protein [Vibrio splendidus]
MNKIEKSNEQEQLRSERHIARWNMIAENADLARQNQINNGHSDLWLLAIPSVDQESLRFLNLSIIEGKSFEETLELTNGTYLRFCNEHGKAEATKYAVNNFLAIDTGTLSKETSNQQLSERIWFIANHFRNLSDESPIEFYETYHEHKTVFVAIQPTTKTDIIK